jgi:hypothetical protein
MAKEAITLKFECDQEWDDMKPTACGRFCNACSKEVYDFTNKSIAEARRIQAEKKVCGHYTREQAEPDLIPIEVPLSKLKISLATAAMFLGIEITQADAKTTNEARIELAAEIINEIAPDPTGRDSRKKKPVKLFKKRKKASKPGAVISPPKRKRKKLYVSKRFPFIHLRRARSSGFYMVYSLSFLFAI